MNAKAWLVWGVLLTCGAVSAQEPSAGEVFSYVKDGVRHYSARYPTSPGAQDIRTIAYSFSDKRPTPEPISRAPSVVPKGKKWRRIFEDEYRAFEANEESITREGKSIRAWVRLTFKKPDESEPKTGHAMWYAEYNCAARTMRELSRVAYGRDGTLISSSASPSANLAIIPDSIGENAWDYFCVQ